MMLHDVRESFAEWRLLQNTLMEINLSLLSA